MIPTNRPFRSSTGEGEGGGDNKPEACPFCPGNESKGPPAELVLILREGSIMKTSDTEGEIVEGWSVRAIPNTRPLVSLKSEPEYSNSPIYGEPAYGYDYILIATPNHDENFSKMSVDQITAVLSAVQDRVKWFQDKKRITYVAVIMDYLKEGPMAHPHIRLLTFPRLPPLIEEEAMSSYKYVAETGLCLMCSILNLETSGPRQILSSDHHIAFVPWAPNLPFEFWIAPKKHQASITSATQKEISDFALALRITLSALSRALKDPPLSLVFHNSPEKKSKKQIHWHAKILPHPSTWGGLELGMGVYMNRYPPEYTAEVLERLCREEFGNLMGA